MPSLSNAALLCELEVFAADNAIRRGILLTTTNNQSASNAISDLSRTIAANTTVTIDPLSVNGMSILRTTGGPVTVTIKFGSPADVASLTAVTFSITNVMMFSTQIASLSVLNPGTDSVRIRFIQI